VTWKVRKFAEPLGRRSSRRLDLELKMKVKIKMKMKKAECSQYGRRT